MGSDFREGEKAGLRAVLGLFLVVMDLFLMYEIIRNSKYAASHELNSLCEFNVMKV